MKTRRFTVNALGPWVLVFLWMGMSAVRAAEIEPRSVEQLGSDLTPMGSTRAGSADGAIPAWDGGIQEPPPSYRPGMHHPDPFPDDAILFTITAANMEKYREKLGTGTQAMLQKYPDTYKLNVYPSRRTASYPQRVYDAIRSNARSARISEDGNGVSGAMITSPFPFPKSGVECIWNHKLRYQGETLERTVAQVTPQRNGDYTVVELEEQIEFDYTRQDVTLENVGNRYSELMQTIVSPPRLAGRILLVHETLDQIKEPRQAWTYNPGQRRVRRAPNVAYDNPGTASDGLRTNDNFDLFNGSPDRYDWKLIGLREVYVPYNDYRLHSERIKLKDLVQPGHLNPDYMRWELHRVWVVEATLKPGVSHIYKRRTFYFDEDSWGILLVDHYDGRDQLWRVGEGHTINYYEVPTVAYTVEVIHDLQAGRYLALGMKNEEKMQVYNGSHFPDAYFTPAGMRTQGRR